MSRDRPKKASKPGDTPVGYAEWCPVVEDRNTTACKHGTGDCELCGTYNRSDRRHKTIGGKGVVARLKERK